METEAAAVSAYIVFLSDHTRDLPLQELDELAFVSLYRTRIILMLTTTVITMIIVLVIIILIVIVIKALGKYLVVRAIVHLFMKTTAVQIGHLCSRFKMGWGKQNGLHDSWELKLYFLLWK